MFTHLKYEYPESEISPEIALCTRNGKTISLNPNLRTILSHRRDAQKYLPSSQAPNRPEPVAVLTGFRNKIVIFPVVYWRERCCDILKEQAKM